jgi:hypothetical protein
MRSECPDLKERRTGIKQRRDPITRQQFAPCDMSFAGGCPAPLGRRIKRSPNTVEIRLVGGFVFGELG